MHRLDDEMEGKQISKSIYKEGELYNDPPILIQKEEFFYDFNTDRDDIFKGILDLISIDANPKRYRYSLNKIELDYSLLTGKKITNYDENIENPIFSRTDYRYSPDVYIPNRIITTDSKGEKIIKRIKTNRDYLSGTTFDNNSSLNMEDLNNEGFIWPIEEQIWSVNTSTGNYKLIDGKVYIYDDITESGSARKLYQPTKHLKLKLGDIDSDDTATFISDYNSIINFSNITWLNGLNDYEYEEDVNLTYDNYGNTIEVNKEDGTSTYYVWGYNQQYPIAKLENFESSQITTAVQDLIDAAVEASDNDDSIEDEDTLRAALKDLREESALASAMVTTYTYDPLIGVTSITDPKGYTMYYEYDKLNRLEFVKDAQGNLVSENKYNYKN